MPVSPSGTTAAVAIAAAGLAAYAAVRFLGSRAGAEDVAASEKLDLLASVTPYRGDPRSRPLEILTAQMSGKAQRASMGLQALEMDDWLRIDSGFDERVIERKEMLSYARNDILLSKPSAKEAVDELWEFIARFLVKRYPDLFEEINGGKGFVNKATGDRWEDIDAVEDKLEAMLVTVPDDFFMLLHHSDTGKYHLDALSCAYAIPPQMNHERFGMSMEGIHGPVPAFKRRVLKPIEKWFDIFSKPSWRANWNMTESGAYLRPHAEYSGGTPSAAPSNTTDPAKQDLTQLNALRFTEGRESVSFSELHFRYEKQNFIRLPKSKAIIFVVRTHIVPLPWLLDQTKEIEKSYDVNDPDAPLPFARRLYSAARRMEEEAGVIEYRGVESINKIIIDYMEANYGMSDKDLVSG